MIVIKSDSVFVEDAASSVAEATPGGGDPQANALLAEVRRHIYYWPTDFPGFSAKLEYWQGEECHRGTLQSPSTRGLKVEWNSEFDSRWVRYQLEELISHREHPEQSRIVSKSGCVLGDDDPIWGRKLIFLSDRMESFYRVQNKRISQIGRSYPKSKFVIFIDEHHEFGRERYAAKSYYAHYWNRESGELTKTETYKDHYTELGGHHLPKQRLVVVATSEGHESRCLRFGEWSLLE